MKKALSLLLALVMLLSLCACGKNDSQATDPSASSQATTEGTEKPTDGTEDTTGATQAPTVESTAAPTDEPTSAPTKAPTKPTEAPTKPTEQPTKPTEAPTKPTAAPTKPTAAPTKPTAAPTKPTAAPTKPTAAPTKPTAAPTKPTTCSHSYKDATCAAPKTCSKCGATEGSVGKHNYQNGTCTVCGDKEVINHVIETSAGYAVSLSADGKRLDCYQIGEEGLLYTSYETQKPASGYYVFRIYNGKTYYTPAPSWGQYLISSTTISGRTVQLDLFEEKLELELISANQYKVTKGVQGIPTGVVFTFGTDMCSFMGHCASVRCEGEVNCMYCDTVVCQGFGHEFGTDDICFRCFSVMRPGS